MNPRLFFTLLLLVIPLKAIRVEGGSEFYISFSQGWDLNRKSVVSIDGGSKFIVAWIDGNGYQLLGKIFSSNGTAISSNIQLSTSSYVKYEPSLSAFEGGSYFVATWYAENQDGSYNGCYGTVFHSNGSLFSSEFRINYVTSGDQKESKPAALRDGRFMVTWTGVDSSDEGIYGRVFYLNGTSLTNEFVVNVYTNLYQTKSACSSLQGGSSFIIVWQSYFQIGQINEIMGRIYSYDGVALTSEFQINQYTTGDQYFPVVADLEGGAKFIVAWSADSNQDGSGTGVYARIFNSSGTPISSEFQVNIYTSNNQDSPFVIALENGYSFVIAWHSQLQDGSSYGVYGRVYNSSGSPLTLEFQINQYTTNDQSYPKIAAIEGGSSFIATWQSYAANGVYNGVYGRIFKLSRCDDLTQFYVPVNSTCSPTCTGLGFAPYNDSMNMYCNFACSTGYSYFSYNSSCLSTCSSPAFTQVSILAAQYCNFKCSSEDYYYSLNDTCSPRCPNYPFTAVNSSNYLYCNFACPAGYYFHEYNNSCSQTCNTDAFTIRNESNHLYCEFRCPKGSYYYAINGSCASNCPSLPFTAINQSNYLYCTFKCPIGSFYFSHNDTCSPSCPEFPFTAINQSNHLYCNFACPSGSYFLSFNNSCTSNCPPSLGFSTVNHSNYLYCNFQCPIDMFYFSHNGSCQNTCDSNLGFIPLNQSRYLFCNFPCSEGNYFYPLNSSCSDSCQGSFFSPLNLSNYLFCIFPCAPGKYFYTQNSTCLSNCPSIEGYVALNKSNHLYCYFHCPGNYYFAFNDSCSASCSGAPFVPSNISMNLRCEFPCLYGEFYYFYNKTCFKNCSASQGFVTQNQSNYLYCSFKCPPGKYYYSLNSTCLPTCSASPFVFTNRTNNFYCDFPCSSDKYYYAFNNSCSKTCPFYSRNESGYLYCDFYCPINHYYFFNSSCLSTCPLPFSVRNETGYLYCDYKCQNNEYLMWTGHCSSNCSFPFTVTLVSNRYQCSYNCPPGQILYFNGSCSSSCLYPIGTQSNTLTVCEACDTENLVCRLGSSYGPKAGFWMYSESASLVLKCPFPEACLGNPLDSSSESLTSHGTCKEGYKGNLCANCQSGYGHLSNFECVTCNNNPIYYIQVFIPVIINIIVFLFTIAKLSQKRDINSDDVFKQSILIRITINYIQINALIGDINIKWPTLLNEIYTYGNKLGSAFQASVTSDCMLDYDDPVENTKFKLILTLLAPLIYSGILCCVWLARYFKSRDLHSFIDISITSLVVIVFNVIPSIIQTNLKFMNCKNLYREDDPKYFYTSNYDMPCWEGSHLSYLLFLNLPSLIIWMILTPILFLVKLNRDKAKLNDIKYLQRYSFIYNGYKKKHFYWEFVVLLRKILTISIVLFFESSLMQILLSLLILGVFLYLHTAFHPYDERELNFIESIGILTSILLLTSAMFFKYREFDASVSQYEIFFIALMLVGSVSFLVLLIKGFFSTTHFISWMKEYKTRRSFSKKTSSSTVFPSHTIEIDLKHDLSKDHTHHDLLHSPSSDTTNLIKSHTKILDGLSHDVKKGEIDLTHHIIDSHHDHDVVIENLEELNKSSRKSVQHIQSQLKKKFDYKTTIDSTIEDFLRENLTNEINELVLDFDFCKKLTDSALNTVIQGLPESLTLVKLNFRNCTQLTDSCLQNFGKKMPRSLTQLDLNFSGCDLITENGVNDLIESLEGIDLRSLRLDFSYCQEIKKSMVDLLKEKVKHIKNVNIESDE